MLFKNPLFSFRIFAFSLKPVPLCLVLLMHLGLGGG